MPYSTGTKLHKSSSEDGWEEILGCKVVWCVIVAFFCACGAPAFFGCLDPSITSLRFEKNLMYLCKDTLANAERAGACTINDANQSEKKGNDASKKCWHKRGRKKKFWTSSPLGVGWCGDLCELFAGYYLGPKGKFFFALKGWLVPFLTSR